MLKPTSVEVMGHEGACTSIRKERTRERGSENVYCGKRKNSLESGTFFFTKNLILPLTVNSNFSAAKSTCDVLFF